MEQEKVSRQIQPTDKCYMLTLAGGLGARIIQTVFIKNLIEKRNKDGKSDWPILVIDHSPIGIMVSEYLKDKNVIGVQIPHPGANWPVEPNLLNTNLGLEHPMFIPAWRNTFQQYNIGGRGNFNLQTLLNNNWDRSYSIEYGFSLTKAIHQHKLNNSKTSFIANHYGKTMGLKYLENNPMLKKVQINQDIQNLLDNSDKPCVLLHLGMDRNGADFQAGVNYRIHKLWSLECWRKIVQDNKDKYTFLQVFANEYNPDLPDVTSIKVDNLNPVMQILEHKNCAFFISIDNFLPHLSAALKKKGIVLWGSVSPYVWGWNHNINIWNKSSCPEIACWRPGMYDTSPNGKLWICDHYSCMKSITPEQVNQEIVKLELELEKDSSKKIGDLMI